MNVAYPRTSALAIVSLIFGILTYFILPFVGALIAVICGHAARSEIRRAPPGMVSGNGLALAGLILGWIQIAMLTLAVAAILLVLVGGIHTSGI